MSCSDVAMQQPVPAACGAPRYLTGGPAVPEVGCPQKKLAVYNKMQESLDVTLPSKQEEDEKDQPAEMEYLNSRCVLFTYFQGDIGSVVDEHFSRALSQASSFNPETALTKSKAGLSPLWRDAFTATTAALLNDVFLSSQELASPHNSCTKILRELQLLSLKEKSHLGEDHIDMYKYMMGGNEDAGAVLRLSSAMLADRTGESSTISSQRSSFPTSFWTSSYQPPPPPCLSGIHPDFPVTAPGTFPTSDPSSWPAHSLHQTAPPPPPAASESWHYPLASQVSPSYAHMHDMYMHRHHPHPHMHHHHPSSHRDPRYGSLLMPSVRAARIPAPQCDVTKTDPTAVTSATSAWAGAFHGTVDIVPSFGFDTGLQHQDKGKETSWF